MKQRIPVFRKDQQLERMDALNCPINEIAGDGRSCGRCYHYCGKNEVCPRHGDVSKEIKRYRETGRLTKENERAGGRE